MFDRDLASLDDRDLCRMDGGAGDQLDDGQVADQRLGAPVMVMKANSLCSMRLHLLVPGGRWFTVIAIPSLSANPCNSRFHRQSLRSRLAWRGARPRLAPACEDFNDDHMPAAAGAGQPHIARLTHPMLRCERAETAARCRSGVQYHLRRYLGRHVLGRGRRLRSRRAGPCRHRHHWPDRSRLPWLQLNFLEVIDMQAERRRG